MTNELDKQSGFILINKPTGITSHDVISKLRRITGIRKIGHAGTLDPFATGLLIVAVSREATREISKFVGMDKTYEAEIILGATTETLDTEAEIKTRGLDQIPTSDEIQKAMKTLTGEIDQVPPMHSAIKVKGQRLYKAAREGKEIKVEPRKITVHEFKIIDSKAKDQTLIIDSFINCSSGTYVRAMARDLASELNTVGYLQNLKRTSIGKFELKNATQLSDLTSENWPKYVKSLEEMAIDE